MKKDAYYFPHFCNARHDRKLKRVQKELGVEGYGIFFMILEVLREQPGFKYPMDDLDLLADEFGTSEQKVKTVVCNYKLFDIDDENNFTSDKMVLYLQPYIERSKKARKAAKARWEAIKNNAQALPEHTPSNAQAMQVKESKVKESKVKDFQEHLLKKIHEKNLDEFSGKIEEFLSYRKSIKKPLKSKQGITGIVNITVKLKEIGLDIRKCLDYTMEKEWQSPPMEFFEKNANDFKKEKEMIVICLASDIWENSKYQAGGLWKNSEKDYINLKADFIGEEDRKNIELNTKRFIDEHCEGGF